MKILYIEDSELDFKLMHTYCDIINDGVELTHARSKEEAEAYLDGGEYDLVLSDMMLTGDSGVEVINQLIAKFGKIKYAIVSCISDDEEVRRALPDAISYVHKPNSVGDVRLMLNKWRES